MRVELGIDSKTFWKLSWWDLNLWIDKIVHDRQKRNEDRELTMEMTRQVLCLIYNANRGKDSPTLQPYDFIKLSYDKESIVEKDVRTPEEVKAKFPEKLPQIKQ